MSGAESPDSGSRIERLFAQLRQDGRTALMPFITAGFPDLDATRALLPRLERAGASICEIGIPFSDPVADGPVIASSMHDALQRGFRVPDLFDVVRELRPTLDMGLVAMVSYSIVHRFGAEAFIHQCRDAGFDGFIFPDLPVDEAGEALAITASARMSCSLLIAPTTPAARAERIAKACTGFVYLLARTGITGERQEAPEIDDRVRAIRAVTDTPIACGFGVSSAETVRAVTEQADAAIVGSAIIRRMRDLESSPRDEFLDGVETFVRDLASGLSVRGGS